MNPKDKWEFYINKLCSAENDTKIAINEYRNYKSKFMSFRYEKGLSEKQRDLFETPPIKFIDNIFAAQARTKFCKLKIEFYKIMSTDGETINNKKKLSELDVECGKILKEFGNKIL